ncbi:MAG: glycosyltransferase family 4 protein [Proteobacteria bacterium]|nr:glycosyltransferase family 4 protein [Pseudomonadota bacterium]
MHKPNILVDSFNLGLQHGSGIKTYGATLLDAYKLLDYQVGIFADNKFIQGKNPVLDEVMFFDQQFHLPKLRFGSKFWSNYRDVSQLWKSKPVKSFPLQVTSPNINNYLSKAAHEKKYSYICNAFDAFHSANRFYSVFKKPVSFKLQNPPDIWHMTTPLPIKIKGVKTVVTIHDLIPLKVPFTTLDVKNNFYNLFKWVCKSADLILSVSEQTKKDIIEIYHVPEEKVQVTWQSVKQIDYKEDLEFEAKYLQSNKIEKNKYVLFVGNIEPKKNIKSLIKAMSLVDEEIKLVIVGKRAWLWEDQLKNLDRYHKKKRVKFMDYVDDDDLAVLYRNATCLVFPSLYEGFGLPVLEAMQNDCPVVCSGITSLPEVAGDAALYIDPYDYTDIRGKISAIIGDDNLRNDMIAKGRKRVEFFSPENYAKRLEKAYSHVL